MSESIGHRPLWGRCLALPSTLSTTYSGTGTADHLTLLRLFCLEKLVKQRKVWIQQKMKHWRQTGRNGRAHVKDRMRDLLRGVFLLTIKNSDCSHETCFQRVHISMNFNSPMRELAEWVSEPMNGASERCERTNVANERSERPSSPLEMRPTEERKENEWKREKRYQGIMLGRRWCFFFSNASYEGKISTTKGKLLDHWWACF